MKTKHLKYFVLSAMMLMSYSSVFYTFTINIDIN